MSTKYQIGDKVWIEFEVVNVDDCSDRPVRVSQSTTGLWWPLASTIKHHIPKPREFKPGDKVRHVDTQQTYEFLSRFGGKAIIGRLDVAGGPCVAWSDESELRHADEVAQ